MWRHRHYDGLCCFVTTYGCIDCSCLCIDLICLIHYTKWRSFSLVTCGHLWALNESWSWLLEIKPVVLETVLTKRIQVPILVRLVFVRHRTRTSSYSYGLVLVQFMRAHGVELYLAITAHWLNLWWHTTRIVMPYGNDLSVGRWWCDCFTVSCKVRSFSGLSVRLHSGALAMRSYTQQSCMRSHGF